MTQNHSDRRPILLIGPMPPPITGQSVAFALLAEQFGRIRPVRIVNLSDPLERRDRQFTLSRALQILRLAASIWRLLGTTSTVYLTIAQSRVGFLRDALFIAIARLRGRPVIVHLHGGNYSGYYDSENLAVRFLIRRTLRSVTRLIVLSESLRRDFDFLGADFAPRLRVVPNASPVPSGRPREAPRGEIQLLYLSNLLVEKGYLDCVDAVAHLWRLLPGVRVGLVLAGTFLLGKDEYGTVEQMEAAFRKHVHYLGVEESVALAGVVRGAEKQRLLESSHIHLLPTYYENEGQPITIIEALASGLPSITTEWRGIVDMVKEGTAGLVVPLRDPLAIAEAVVRMYRDPALYEHLSATAIAAAHTFVRERHVAEMAGVFDEVCGPAGDGEPRT